MDGTNRGPRGVNYTDFDKFVRNKKSQLSELCSFHPLTQDYPSVGQINEKLREFDIIPILAATDGANRFYEVSTCISSKYMHAYIVSICYCVD